MSVERLPSGGWRCRWRDADGTPRSKGDKSWTKREAKAYERKMLAQRDLGVSSSDMTVAELADLWLASARDLADSTREVRRKELDRAVIPRLGRMRVQKVTSADIDDYLAHIAVEGYAPTTQKHTLKSILGPMFNYARKRGLILQSPTADVASPRVPPKEMRFLSMEELRLLASHLPDRWQRMVLFTGIMGPRWSEVTNMRPGDIQGTQALIRGTKSRSSVRRVSMPAFVQKVVAEQLEQFSSPSLLWPTVNNKPMNRTVWGPRIWRPALEAAGIPHLRFHDLRHTAAALAIASGGNPVLVQRRLGHSSIGVTLGTYGHLFPEADEQVADKLDAMWEETDDA